MLSIFKRKNKTRAIPAKISGYKILQKLGEGGMGQVYLAEDATLNRQVAIKILSEKTAKDETFRKRLIKEAQAAAILDHPNICHIYEAGKDTTGFYIVMQYIKGETLSRKNRQSPLPWRAVLELAIPLADALAEAHTHGIIHRDIKPQNIIVTPKGQPKLLDFGLAQTTPAFMPGGPDAETVESMTKVGLVAGSPPYMSPEQVHGEPVDARTDIFSFGSVLYEIASGRHPFAAEGIIQTMTAIATKEPIPLTQFTAEIPVEFERIIGKCLAKDRNRRYQSFREVLVDLRYLDQHSSSGSVETGAFPKRAIAQQTANSTIDAIAIVPFTNTSKDPELEYLIEGITENIINRLSRLPRLKVMARTTVFKYKGRDIDAQTIGRELNTRAVATGRVALVRNQLMVGVELVDTLDGSQLWGEKYNRTFADIFAIEEDISNEIADKLRQKIGRKERKEFSKRDTEDSEAYQLYLKGRYYWLRREGDDLYKAMEYFEAASKKDPDFALPFAGMADCYSIFAFSSLQPPTEAMPKAKASVRRALELDADLSEGYATLGWIRFVYDWDWTGSESAFERSLELNPRYPMAHFWYAHLLLSLGRTDQAMEMLWNAKAIDPDSPLINSSIAWFYYLTRRNDDALQCLQETLALDPAFPRTHWVLGQTYEQTGQHEEAIASFQKACTLSMGSHAYLACLGHAYAIAGKRTEAGDILDRLQTLSKKQYISSFDIAEIYAGLGEIDEAFRYLDISFAEKPKFMVDLCLRPNLDPLRTDPRFRNLVERVGLPS